MSLQRTPFYDDHVALGGRIVPFAGFELPVQYRGVIPEHEAVRTSAGLFDVSHMGEVFVRGPRAFDTVQYLVTNDVSRLGDGDALYTCMCNESGGVVDDLVVYRLAADEYLICVNAANRAKDFAFMQAHDPFGAELVDEGDAWAQLAIQGPAAPALVQRLASVDVLGLRRYTAARASFAGVDGCLVARTGYTGEDGFEVFAPVATSRALFRDVLAAGADDGLEPIGLGARDTLRLEAGMHLYGHELTDDTTPWQAGLARVVAMDKPGGFVGRDALLARKGNAAEKLVSLTLEGKRIPRQGMTLSYEGEPVGTVTSGTLSPTLGYGIALAYLRRDLDVPGATVDVDIRGKLAPAVVRRGAFYKRPA
jgi:aminomethyltransferase